MQSLSNSKTLPPGQKAREDFPRFGLSPYAKRYQEDFGLLRLTICGESIESEFVITSTELGELKRRDLQADFHCVTTWSKQNLKWSGFGFSQFYHSLIEPILEPKNSIHWVIFKSIDGYRSRMLLQDLLVDDILLADKLDDKPLCSSHGAPLRLVAPAHYGYKNPKYLKRIEFHSSDYKFKPPLLAFMEHPRARAALEERGQFFPGWLLRWLYRPMINSTVDLFKKTMK
jgi:DMSO/TMAO reductase YedYZ molybdopterin-dependent catalytic subunit